MRDVRRVRRVRRVAGDAWVVTVVLAAPSGDLHVADVTVDDAGAVAPKLGPDHVIEAVRRAEKASLAQPPAEELREILTKNVSLRTLAPGDVLVTEGEPSRSVFVVKSGLVGVWLEKPEGGSWMVRCCFPGAIFKVGLGNRSPFFFRSLSDPLQERGRAEPVLNPESRPVHVRYYLSRRQRWRIGSCYCRHVHLSDLERSAVAEFCRRVRARFGPRVRQLVLFGSRARGDADEESDIDVCVVIDQLHWRDKHEVWAVAGAILEEQGVLVSAFVLGAAELEWLAARERRIAREIAAEGVPL